MYLQLSGARIEIRPRPSRRVIGEALLDLSEQGWIQILRLMDTRAWAILLHSPIIATAMLTRALLLFLWVGSSKKALMSVKAAQLSVRLPCTSVLSRVEAWTNSTCYLNLAVT